MVRFVDSPIHGPKNTGIRSKRSVPPDVEFCRGFRRTAKVPGNCPMPSGAKNLHGITQVSRTPTRSFAPLRMTTPSSLKLCGFPGFFQGLAAEHSRFQYNGRWVGVERPCQQRIVLPPHNSSFARRFRHAKKTVIGVILVLVGLVTAQPVAAQTALERWSDRFAGVLTRRPRNRPTTPLACSKQFAQVVSTEGRPPLEESGYVGCWPTMYTAPIEACASWKFGQAVPADKGGLRQSDLVVGGRWQADWPHGRFGGRPCRPIPWGRQATFEVQTRRPAASVSCCAGAS